MERVKLTPEQIEAALGEVAGWSVEDGKLSKRFEFGSYASGVLFTAAVAHVADQMDHHPDLALGYRKVTVAVITHDVGGISPWDFELARRVDALTR